MTDKTVVVTGFGPFEGHPVNTSWECVKLLKEMGLGDNVELVIYEIPVEYITVRKRIPEMWSTHKPDLVVHLGVSDVAMEITLEQQAHNEGYKRLDVTGFKADDLCCMPEADEDCIISGLDMKHICAIVNQSGTKAKAVISHDPGRYLCDFSYFASLYQNRDRSAFIHVPPLDKPYTVQELTDAVKVAIRAMLDCVGKLS